MANRRDERLGLLVKSYRQRAGLTQGALAAMVSNELGDTVTQGQVSDHENGRRWMNPDLPGAYTRVLRIPQREVIEALGFTADAADAPVTLEDYINADPTLSDAAKRHILMQYGLLQLATQAERAGRPVLPPLTAQEIEDSALPKAEKARLRRELEARQGETGVSEDGHVSRKGEVG